MPPLCPDYDRLRVFSYTVELNAPTYRAIMAVFAATKARFKLQLRSEDLRRALEEQGLAIPENGLEPALDQLVEWGNLVRAHDTRRVATLSDFYRRHFVYRITPAGEAAEVAVGAVVAAMQRSGSLQKVMLGTIARRLARVVAELREPAPDPAALYEALFDLTHQFESLAENASTFMAKLHEALEMTVVNATAWVAYKEDVIAYLQDFIGELSRSSPQTIESLEELRRFGLDRICAIAAEADQAPTLDGEHDDASTGEVERLAARLRGVCEWFLGDGIEPATVELLRAAAREAVNRILLVLERLHESRFKKVNRTTDLLQLAEWFAECPDGDSAHRLAQTAFGMFSARHLAESLEDPTAVAAATSWWDAPPAAIAVAMRERGDAKRLGRTARIVDHSGTKRRLDEARHRAEAARRQALGAFVDRGPQRLSQLGVLDEMEFEALLGLLDRLLAAQPDDAGVRRATSGDGRLRMELTPPRDRARASVRTARGVFRLYDWELEVAAIARRASRQSAPDPGESAPSQGAPGEDAQREGVA